MLTDMPIEENTKSLAIPSIYLNSSDRQDAICLHTPQDDTKTVQFGDLQVVDDKTPTNDCYGRRASQRSWCSEPEAGAEFNWLDTFDPSRSVKKRFQKRRSSSSSSGYTQSASHVSTCGSKSRFGSFGCRSLPEVSSEVDLRLLAAQDCFSTLSTRRQVKSCSNLAIVKDRKLPAATEDDKSDSGTEGEVKKTFEEILDKSYASVPQTLESQTQKEERIQHWLRNLYVPPEEET